MRIIFYLNIGFVQGTDGIISNDSSFFLFHEIFLSDQIIFSVDVIIKYETKPRKSTLNLLNKQKNTHQLTCKLDVFLQKNFYIALKMILFNIFSSTKRLMSKTEEFRSKIVKI